MGKWHTIGSPPVTLTGDLGWYMQLSKVKLTQFIQIVSRKNYKINSFLFLSKLSGFNSLHPNIYMQILHTVLYISLCANKENLFNSQSCFSRW